MKLRGGYNIRLAGRPGDVIESLRDPEELLLPLFSRRLKFSELCVQDGQRVRAGDAIARDPGNHGVPLLAGRSGTVRLGVAKKHVVLRDLSEEAAAPLEAAALSAPMPATTSSVGMMRYKLLALGAWTYFHDAHTGTVPAPFGTPRAVIVSTLQLEAFLVRGDVQLRGQLPAFVRGLEQIQSLLSGQPVHLVLPKVNSPLAVEVRRAVAGRTGIRVFEVPLRYPFDHFRVLASVLGLRPDAAEPVWALRVEGVLAADRALTASLPCLERVISLGGPAVKTAAHLRVLPGHPWQAALAGRLADGPVRVLRGGVLTGQALGSEQLGLDGECGGVTVLAEHTVRELLSFARPGRDRQSFSRCFLSSLLPPPAEPMTTAVRGEKRPCVSCGFCEEVCPRGMMPHLIHKLLYQDDLEAAEQARVDLCIACGLCTFVCPSKIELCHQFQQAIERIGHELHGQETVA